MPPSHWSKWRQRLTDWGSVSRLEITVAPVVVIALTASKIASIVVRSGRAAMIGGAAASDSTNQTNTTSSAPSRG